MLLEDLPQKFIRIFLGLCLCLYFVLRYNFQVNFPKQFTKYTIRVNTFRRNDLLEKFLQHYTTCEDVTEIQVVWSDLKNKPPADIMIKYNSKNVKYEIHESNSLNNRFYNLIDVPTEVTSHLSFYIFLIAFF